MGNNEINLDVKRTIAHKRVAYTTPSLTIYGELRDLTATGSGPYGENPDECNFYGPGMHGPLCKNNPMA